MVSFSRITRTYFLSEHGQKDTLCSAISDASHMALLSRSRFKLRLITCTASGAKRIIWWFTIATQIAYIQGVSKKVHNQKNVF